MNDPMPFALRCLTAVLIAALLVAASLVSPQSTDSPLPSSDAQVANLEAFARLYGVVRWFHPSDEAAEADWNRLAIEGVRIARCAASPQELAERLESLFLPVAPSLVVFREHAAVSMPDLASSAGCDASVRVWEHVGVETSFSPSMGDVYHSTRLTCAPEDLPDGANKPESPLRLELGHGISAWVATSVYCDAEGTLPRARTPQDPMAAPITDEEDGLLADAIVIWNVARHFSPYLEEVDVDWDATLGMALHEIVADGTDFTYNDMRAFLCIPLQDGHAGLWNPPGGGYAQAIPDIATAYVDGGQIVTAVEGDALEAGLRPGDRILSVNGVSSEDLLSDWMNTISGSEHKRISLGTTRLLLDRKDSVLDLEVEDIAGSVRSFSLIRSRPYPVSPRHLEPTTELEPGILYVDVSRASPEDLDALAEDLPTYAGVLIDARGYPYDRFWATRFLAQSARSMELSIPVKHAPDAASSITQTMTANPQLPEGTQPELVFLINADAFSAGEHQLAYFVNAGIGTFVGTATAGCNGNINRIALPSGGAFGWTGMRAGWADGSLFHNVGIQPDLWVEPTREGIADGRDEQLDAGLRLLKEKLAIESPR